jgi:hypothetical protein
VTDLVSTSNTRVILELSLASSQKQQILAADSSPSNISNSSSSSAQEDFILVLDPSEMTGDIVKCLSAQTGWQNLLKRSTQTLRHPEAS